MTRSEFESWADFYQLYPFDDMHIHYRPTALIAKSLGGGDIKSMIEWLQPPVQSGPYSQADLNTLAAFGFKPEN
ncbi:hypothetical protein CAL14_05585 [Bordetella genomosp. 9]|uniref:hypothetical protein n=1 Tax=Bordetella genomosp. 9 TaxID=1416803 RepID=UPI000A295B35|nr:hypothetical protein [Bordetella genomosp. 9]ARP89826.1 hypothetical protein CAL14_05585 [Bordetella genomosp. 9]